MELREIIQELRHEIRNSCVNVHSCIRRMSEAEMEIRKNMIEVLNQLSRIENAVNDLDKLNYRHLEKEE